MGGTQSSEHPLVALFLAGNLNETTLRQTLNPQTAPIDGVGRKGDNVITLASSVGAANIVRLALDHGANIIGLSSGLMYKRTPFHVALVNKQEHIAMMLFFRSEFVRATCLHFDAVNHTPLMHATKNNLIYSVWMMLLGIHAFTSFPLRTLPDLRTWTDLSYQKFICECRRAFLSRSLYQRNNAPWADHAIRFATTGLPATVYLSGDRNNYDYLAKNTQNFFSLWPNLLKYSNPINLNQPPILSTPIAPQSCQHCSSNQCLSNECVLLCYLGHIHQFKEFMKNGLLQNIPPNQSADPSRRQAIIAEFAKFLPLINQTTAEETRSLYKLPSTSVLNDLLPSFLHPPPILLSAAIQDQYLCTRLRCVCQQPNPQQPQCLIYPPLLTIPTIPLSNLTMGGHHNNFCQTLELDQQHKTVNLTNISSSIVTSKSNIHSTDIIALHQDYLRAINRIYHIPQQGRQNTGGDLCRDVNIPGFSVPVDYHLSRFLDATTKPIQSRPKNLSEKASGLFSGIVDFATAAFSQDPKFEDGTKPTTLDQIEPIMMNNIRYHANRLPLDNKFTAIAVGEKRDCISPLRMTEESPNNVFSSFYPTNAPQILAYEHTPPILDSTYTTTAKLQKRTAITPKEITTSIKHYIQSRPPLPPTLYTPISAFLSKDSADLTQPIAPISTKDQYQYSHTQTCLCGAHNSSIEPVLFNSAAVAFNVDGRPSLRLTDRNPEHRFLHIGDDDPFDTVLLASLTPHTTIIYRPARSGLAEAMKTFDYGFPGFQRSFEKLTPPLNPTHDLSNASNNSNSYYYNHSNGPRNAVSTSQQGECRNSEGSVMPDLNKLGDLIISPNHHISIVIPDLNYSAIYLAANLHRVMVAKYPHYELMTKWMTFTTRVSGAVMRLAQRRLTRRLITSELNLLTIFLEDTRFLINAYRQHFGDHLNNPSTPGQLSVAVPYFIKQTEATDNYLIFLEKYIALRQFRLQTIQYTPGSNILALFGNIQNTDEFDNDLLQHCNPSMNSTNGTFENPHPGNCALITNFSYENVEQRLTSRSKLGAGVLTDVPTPLPPGFPNTPHTGPPPPGTSTLRSFTETTTASVSRFQAHYNNQVREFANAYPKLAEVPNGSILIELDGYYKKLKRWESNRTTPPPTPLNQPYSVVDNFMLDTFMAVIPNIIRGFIQRVQLTMGELQKNMSNPSFINIHRTNLLESFQILDCILKQAINLDRWLCLPEISPHFHTKTHQFVIRDANNALQFTQTPSVILPSLAEQRHQLAIDPHAGFNALVQGTTYPTPTNNLSTPSTRSATLSQQSFSSIQHSFNQPPQPSTPSHQTHNQAVMTMQLPARNPQHQQNSFYPTLPNNNNYYSQPPTSQNNIQQQQQLPSIEDDDGMAPPLYDLDDSAPVVNDPNYGAPPTYGTTGIVNDDEYIIAPKFTYYDDQHQREREEENRWVEEQARSQQQQQESGQPMDKLYDSLGGLFHDDHDEITNASTYDVNQLQSPPQLHRTDSDIEREYFASMVMNEPGIVLVLDDDYVAKLEKNIDLLRFLKDTQPQIWTQFTNVHPHLVKVLVTGSNKNATVL